MRVRWTVLAAVSLVVVACDSPGEDSGELETLLELSSIEAEATIDEDAANALAVTSLLGGAPSVVLSDPDVQGLLETGEVPGSRGVVDCVVKTYERPLGLLLDYSACSLVQGQVELRKELLGPVRMLFSDDFELGTGRIDLDGALEFERISSMKWNVSVGDDALVSEGPTGSAMTVSALTGLGTLALDSPTAGGTASITAELPFEAGSRDWPIAMGTSEHGPLRFAVPVDDCLCPIGGPMELQLDLTLDRVDVDLTELGEGNHSVRIDLGGTIVEGIQTTIEYSGCGERTVSARAALAVLVAVDRADVLDAIDRDGLPSPLRRAAERRLPSRLDVRVRDDILGPAAKLALVAWLGQGCSLD